MYLMMLNFHRQSSSAAPIRLPRQSRPGSRRLVNENVNAGLTIYAHFCSDSQRDIIEFVVSSRHINKTIPSSHWREASESFSFSSWLSSEIIFSVLDDITNGWQLTQLNFFLRPKSIPTNVALLVHRGHVWLGIVNSPCVFFHSILRLKLRTIRYILKWRLGCSGAAWSCRPTPATWYYLRLPLRCGIVRFSQNPYKPKNGTWGSERNENDIALLWSISRKNW